MSGPGAGRRSERSASLGCPGRSVLTYARVGGHLKTLAFCQGSHYLAVASDSGSIQVLAVEANKPPKSPKVQPFQSR